MRVITYYHVVVILPKTYVIVSSMVQSASSVKD
jgi:hypothetical protein